MSSGPESRGLGLTLVEGGARFRVVSRHAERLWLCVFGAGAEERRIPLERDSIGVWEGWVDGMASGARYGLRADGPYEPLQGHRFDAAKLLVDPYARAVAGGTRWTPSLARPGAESAADAPRSIAVDAAFDWRGDRPPGVPWSETVLYEAHVKGMTRLHPAVPEGLRGTYAGLAHPAVVEHLLDLGVTTLELLPVQQSFVERHLVVRGLTNYWGYNPVAFFAPQRVYAAGPDPVAEFKEMVRAYHAAGLEVVLDVVFNHTAEGGAEGPTLSLRGLDNATYYRAHPQEPGAYANWSGCGNSLHFGRPEVVAMTIDCLRYWVDEMHVDGFRFDLATTLGRGDDGRFSARAPFFAAVAADPVLSKVKLIAEPWDAGPDGYQLGGFPAPWREWNDRFRDQVRAHWQGVSDTPTVPPLRLGGSPDLFPAARGGSSASINYVAAHDGFTLADLVSYERKRNEANGEGNRDGHDHRLSHGWGVEGSTVDTVVLERRDRARRGLMATLALAAGVPMISHGDELGRTQRGNNNAYCQDNDVSWVDWRADRRGREFLDFCRRLFRRRRRRTTDTS